MILGSAQKRLWVIAPLLAAWASVAASGAERKSSFFHTPAVQARDGEPLVIDGLLVKAGDRIERVVLHYRGPGTPFQALVMSLQYSDLYRVEIPGSDVKTPGIEYFIDGLDRDGTAISLFMSEARPARVIVSNDAKPRPPKAESRNNSSVPPQASPSATAPTANPAAAEATLRPSKAEAKPKGSELEEDLALYGGEDRVPQIAQLDQQARSPEVVETLSREQMRVLGARTVAEALNFVPGITVSRDVSGFYRIAVRGQRNDPEVLFLINGRVLNNEYDGRALINWPLDNLDRIEIRRGPGPVAGPRGAFLAVIDLITTSTEGAVGAATAGLFSTFDGHLAGQRTLGDFKIMGDGDVMTQAGQRLAVQQDGLNQQTLLEGLRHDALDPAGSTQDNRFFANVGVGASYSQAGWGKLGLNLRWVDEQRAAWIGLFDALGTDSQLGWRILSAQLTYEIQLSPQLKIEARASVDDQLTTRLYQVSPSLFSTDPSFDSQTGQGAPQFFFPNGVQEELVIGTRALAAEGRATLDITDNNQLLVGAEVGTQSVYRLDHDTNYTLDPTNSSGPIVAGSGLAPAPGLYLLPSDVSSRVVVAAYVQDQWGLLPGLDATLGLRLDSFQLPQLAPGCSPDGTPSAGCVRNQKAWFVALEPRVAVSYVPVRPLVLKVNYSRAVRPPVVSELADEVVNTSFNGGRFAGNPNLKPPIFDQVELSGDWVQAVGEARVRLRGQVFFENIANVISYVDDTGDIPLVSNRTGVRVYGAEGEARVSFFRRADAWANASYFQAVDESSLASFQLLTDVPQGRFNAGITIPLGDILNLDVAVATGTERRNDSRTALEAVRRYQLPPFALVNAQLRTETLWEHLVLSLMCRNIFNQAYADDAYRPDRMPGGVPRDGFSAMLNARAGW